MKRTLYTILICMLTWKVSADTDKLLPFMVDGVIDTTNYETAGLESTPDIKTVTIFKAGEQTDHYANGVVMTAFKGKLYCMWQSSPKDEDSDDTWVAYSISFDNGTTWSKPQPLALPTKDFYCTSGGWLVKGDTLTAFIDTWQKGLEPRGGKTNYIISIDGLQAGVQSERPYSQGRPSNGGGSNAAPCKSFAAFRIIPTFYYTGYEDGDKRMDPSMTVTGSDGKGNEAILQFVPGSRLNGGISNNKWDDNRMDPPYVAAQRQSGINYVELRVADVMLMQAIAKYHNGDTNGAASLLNQIRQRAFGNNSHDYTSAEGDLLAAIYQERKRELLSEGVIRWDMILSGDFTERTNKIRADIQTMCDGIDAKGYYQFANGRQIPAYIWIKNVKLDNSLTFDRDESNPALTPGWRGQYDYSGIAAVASKVSGTEHNLAIQGLFKYIDPNGAEAAALEADGYTRQDWGVEIVKQRATIFDRNILGGLGTAGNAPRYYHPIPQETLTQSKGQVTNGYGLPQK